MSAHSMPLKGRSHTPPRRRRLTLSPEPVRGRGGPKIIVRRTIKEANATIVYPTLTRTNYDEWTMLMQVNMEAAGIWYAVEPHPDEEVEYRNDRLALAAILRSVPVDMLPTLCNKRSARAAWEAVKTIRVGVDRVRECNAQQLRRDDISDAAVVRKMLDVVPEHLEQIAISVETFLDLNTVTIEEVTGRLRAVEQRRRNKTRTVDNQGRLLMTQEEWTAKLKIGGNTGSSSGSGGSGSHGGSGGSSGGRRGASQGRGRGTGGFKQATGPGEGSSPAKKSDKCCYCGKKGHWAKECRSRLRNEAHLAHADEDEEPMLMVATAEVNATASDSSPHSPAPPPAISAPIHLDESKLFVQLGDGAEGESTRWILDTGATNHMTSARSAFSELDTGVRGTVKFGDGSIIGIEGRGTILFKCRDGEHQALKGVYHIPCLSANIVSLGQLDEEEFKWSCEHGIFKIWDQRRRLLAKSGDPAWRWHARYGHLNFRALEKLARDSMVRGMPRINHVNQACDSCLAGKQRRLPFPAEAKYRAENKLELVHGDICGPVTPATPSGNKLFLLLVDDLSRFMWLILLSSKDQAAGAIKNFLAGAEAEAGRKLRTLRTDRGGEFTAHAFAEYCAEHGIQRHLTAPSTPQQNGVVERRNQTVMGMARSMMKAKSLPGWFWGEAVNTAVFLLNRAPTQSVIGKTPYEVWHGVKPPVHFLRTFGCVAHVKNGSQRLAKLDDRSTPMVFVGYEAGTKAFRFYNPVSRRVHVSCDAVFEEERSWDWGADKGAGPDDDIEPFQIEHSAATPVDQEGFTSTPLDTTPRASSAPAPATSSETPGRTGTALPAPAARTPSPTPQATIEFTSPPERELDLDDDHDDDAPLRFRALDNVLGSTSPPQYADRREAPASLMVAIEDDEPATAEEAKRVKEWRDTMIEEMASIEHNQTWSLVTLPAGQRAIGLKWVFKIKKDEHGNVTKHKVRLVAKGYVQRQGIDYEEVFAPVARMESVRVLLAVAAHRSWSVHHMDVKSAFLNGDLVEEVYVQQPPGFIAAGHERASECEHGLYTRGDDDKRLVVGIYVDDLIITRGSTKVISAFKGEMKTLFRMSDLGVLSYYLGIEVRQGRHGIELRQTAYAKKILEKAGMGTCNPCATPMEVRLKLSKQSSSPAVDATEYRSLIGSLRYLMNTRPDMAFAVGYLSRFMEDPRQEHMAAIKHLLRYVAGTIDYGLSYSGGDIELQLVGYSDSDMAGDVDDRKSTSGIIYFLGGSPVAWQSQKQRVVALSSCEAEYIAGAAAACQGVWLRRLLENMVGAGVLPPQLKMDNQSAIALSKNPVLHDRSKHIDTKFHFLRESVDSGAIRLVFVSTQGQLADIMTKALGRAKFQELRELIGVTRLK
ncbi:hypothetical protein QOZ80_3BG0277590 [Eleusine coracana subsp. coracana]|nr:hypothetical protein QOZ80_3BG0277590 [Eleusine coracana subsp. coracana]